MANSSPATSTKRKAGEESDGLYKVRKRQEEAPRFEQQALFKVNDG